MYEQNERRQTIHNKLGLYSAVVQRSCDINLGVKGQYHLPNK